MAKFCSECGAAVNGAKFCPECGHPTGAAEAASDSATTAPTGPTEPRTEESVWEGSPDPVLSPMAAKKTKYEITTERIRVTHGMIGQRTDSLDLFRVRDVQVKRSMTQRARGRGDLIIRSTDSMTPELKLESIAEPDETSETLRRLVQEARKREGVQTRET